MNTTTTTTEDVCGTPKGFWRHRRAGETHCEPCNTAGNAYERERGRLRRIKDGRTPRPPRTGPNNAGSAGTQEIVEEIRHMLSLRQGHGYIIKAIGYQGRVRTLETRLQKAGYGQVYRDLMEEPGTTHADPLSRRGLLRA